MINTLDQQITIAVLDDDLSSIDGSWVQQVSGHSLKIEIVGVVPYNLLQAGKLVGQINQSIVGIVCQHIIDIEQE